MTRSAERARQRAKAPKGVSRSKTLYSPAIPPEVRALLGPPPITSEEDGEGYERILSQMAQAISPKDIVEWIWVKDIVDLTWDAGRARRARVVRLALARRTAIETILGFDQPDNQANIYHSQVVRHDRANNVYLGDANALESFAAALERMGLSEQSIEDAAYLAALNDIERLQQLIDSATARRDAVLREIDRRRESFSRRARPAIDAIEMAVDAEFE